MKGVILCLILLIFISMQPVNVFADEIKNVSNKVGNQISSEVLGKVLNEVGDTFEEINCRDDPGSWGCTETKQLNLIVYIVLIVFAVLGVVGFCVGVYKFINRLRH